MADLSPSLFSHYTNLADLHRRAATRAKELGELLYALTELTGQQARAQREFDEACTAMQAVRFTDATLAVKGTVHLRVGQAALDLQAAITAHVKQRQQIRELREALAGTQWQIDSWYTESNPEGLKRSHTEEQQQA